MVFNYKPGTRYKCPAQIAGELCQQLEQSGGLTPKRLLDASRDEDTPLHNDFEWDDSVAAEHYREEQAAQIIRCIIVKPESANKPPVRAFFNVVGEADSRDYRSVDVIIKTPSLREQLLNSAKKDMESFKAKYRMLKELTGVILAIDAALDSQDSLNERSA